MDVDDCLKKGLIKKTSKNTALAKSLLEMSDIKEDTVKKAKLDDRSINAYVPLAYDALREVLEAICSLHGYKVTSHVCIGELMRKLVKDFDYVSFDRFRYVRNGINYYGTKIDLEEGKAFIQKMNSMRAMMKQHVKR